MPFSLPQLFSFASSAPRYAGLSTPSTFCARFVEPEKGSSDANATLEGGQGEGENVFDYVICGGGTAGCVLASRLSEDPSIRVLLIEAGESDQKLLFSRIPAGWPNLFKTPADSSPSTVPQPALQNRTLYHPRGKMLGGCSSMNAQCVQWCAPADYDRWEEKGAKGWGWQDLEPYFRKAEGFVPDASQPGIGSDRARDGVWKSRHPGEAATNEITKAFVETGPNVGVPHNPDLNRATNTCGITRFQAHVDSRGQRSSTSAAYLPSSVYTRPNLSILTFTTVERLLLSRSGEKCVGVVLSQEKDPKKPRFVARASRDVILSLGSFSTPQLLLCSGIGPRSALDAAEVECAVENDGVGQGLKDHLLAGIFFEARKGSSWEWVKDPVKTLPSLIRWLTTGTGPLSSNMAEAAAFLRSSDVSPSGEVVINGPNEGERSGADLEIITAPVWFLNHSLTPPPNTSGDYFTMASTILHPHSNGSVKINSGSVWDMPLIDPGYLKDPRDAEVLLAGLRLIRRMSTTSPLSSYLLKPASPSMTPEEFANATDEQLLEHARETAETIYHPIGSCKIGPRDEGGAIDPSLRVYGLSNVRVCDASVFPDAVSGHPVAAVIAIAEKFADMLKAEVRESKGTRI
ncbi:choline dehydrogenase [Rhodotorula toruloides]|uniref:Choline dehydrogenase n=1 Tax=Rhodotorula toruloides TaxID=5286 RepID=A0A511KN49_RHOTO|nr:choline dehydrogenase [Rhodotorula toruloides]